jgi:hypothetical protein
MELRRMIVIAAALAGLSVMGGCATLEVTPVKGLSPTAERQKVTVGIQSNAERIREALGDPAESPTAAASRTMFEKVVLLPTDTRFQQPAEIKAAHGTDYILSIGLSDISMAGNLNPYWVASLPILVFKVYAPIVTFETTVQLEATARDARTGAVIMQKEIAETATDHFSPMSPEQKVRKLVSRAINNAVGGLLRDLQKGVAASRRSN